MEVGARKWARYNLEVAASLADAFSFSQGLGGILDMLHPLHPLKHTALGHVGCVIGSRTHEEAVAVGFSYAFNCDEGVDLVVHVFFGGNGGGAGGSGARRWRDAVFGWLAATLHWYRAVAGPALCVNGTNNTSSTTPSTSSAGDAPPAPPAGNPFYIHSGYGQRFRRLWPVIRREIEAAIIASTTTAGTGSSECGDVVGRRATTAATTSTFSVGGGGGVVVDRVRVTVAGTGEGAALAALTSLAIDRARLGNRPDVVSTATRTAAATPTSTTVHLDCFDCPPVFFEPAPLKDTAVRCTRFAVADGTAIPCSSSNSSTGAEAEPEEAQQMAARAAAGVPAAGSGAPAVPP
jgi:hypothetical protein